MCSDLNPMLFRKFTKLTIEQYEVLLKKVAPKLTRRLGSMSPNIKLLATLRYLGTGHSIKELSFETRISQPALADTIIVTCKYMII